MTLCELVEAGAFQVPYRGCYHIGTGLACLLELFQMPCVSVASYVPSAAQEVGGIIVPLWGPEKRQVW